jgi:predicted metalloprotease
MQWRGRRQSQNIEDRRGMSGGKVAIAGGGLGTIVLVLIVLLLGGDPRALLQNMPQGGGGSAPTQSTQPPGNDEAKQFIAVVLAETEETWTRIFREAGSEYRPPTLVLFSDAVQSACGYASSAVGPFYCPADSKVYLDTTFFIELEQRFGAKGDFAAAYVVAHEVGHHVQNLLGVSRQMQKARGQLSEIEYNQLSVRAELQADYFAGVFAHHAQQKNLLDAGDIEEAIRCAQAIGDDRLQKQAQGHVVPDSFTHGTSEQRARWFMKGFKSGDLRGGDTFNASEL